MSSVGRAFAVCGASGVQTSHESHVDHELMPLFTFPYRLGAEQTAVSRVS